MVGQNVDVEWKYRCQLGGFVVEMLQLGFHSILSSTLATIDAAAYGSSRAATRGWRSSRRVDGGLEN